MATHHRSRSKGALSLFSLDSMRSLSRTGARPVVRQLSTNGLPDRSDSSLSHSCDPFHQPPASPEPSVPPSAHVLSTSHPEAGDAQSEVGHPADGDTPSAQDGKSVRRRTRHLRPLSWVPFSRAPASVPGQYPRSHSVQLPIVTSSPIVARSVISAPVLTSTTNVEIARTEGVHCGEISDLAFTQSPGDGLPNDLNTSTRDFECPGMARDDTASAPPRPTDARGRSTPLSYLSLKRSRKPTLGYTLRSKILNTIVRKRAGQPPDARPIQATTGAESHGPSTTCTHSPDESARLYRRTIGRFRRNARNHANAVNEINDTQLALSVPEPPRLSPLTETKSKDWVKGDTSTLGSLTRSFASAVDKLDLHSSLPRNMSFLKSTSFHARSRHDDHATAEQVTEGRQVAGAPSTMSLHPLLASPLPIFRPTESHAAPPAPSAAGPALADNETGHSPFTTSCSDDNVFGSHFEPRPGDHLGVNPLRRHPPDPVEFDSPLLASRMVSGDGPSGGENAVPSRAMSPTELSEDEDCADIDDAPIFSPSSGDLSQYARDTPPSTRVNRPEPRPGHPVETTPTRTATKPDPPTEKPRGLLKKSKSGIGLFSRSRWDRSSVTGMDSHGKGSGGHTPSSSALFERDANRVVARESGKKVKKSRSLHFGGLFKRESESDLRQPKPRDLASPFQPTTPSPLRNMIRARKDDDDDDGHRRLRAGRESKA